MTSFETSILPLLGDDWRVLHPRRTEDTEGGGDLDLAVRGLDPLWPLRLKDGWRLCQCIHYDVLGWTWILENGGKAIDIDTLDDPGGLGRMRFATLPTFRDRETVTNPSVRAVYLTAKRLHKDIRDPEEWERIGILARAAPLTYVRALEPILGIRLAQRLAEVSLSGRVPDEIWLEARRAQQLRPLRHPTRAVREGALRLARLAKRVRFPTGLYVQLVGPDGVGKSTVAETLARSCQGLFRHEATFHWRPGVLPRASAIVRRPPGDPTDPHGRPPHGRIVSLLLLAYYWIDFVAGSWLRIWPFRLRTGLVVVERGWWDMGVDPARYRLRVPPRLVSALGRLIPAPDLVLVLEAPAESVYARKAELPPSELARQARAWRNVVPARVRATYLDATMPPEDVASAAREEIAALLEARAVAQLGTGWVVLPWLGEARWILPRGQHRVASSALRIYQPVTLRGRIGWEAARCFAALGGFRLLPHGAAPPRVVRECLAPYIPRGGTIALAVANHAGRYTALILGEHGEHHAVAKIATDEFGRGKLAREARALSDLGSRLEPPLRVPRVLAVDQGFLILEAVDWRPRGLPWRLPPSVARSLGALFAAGATPRPDPRGPAHGDFAPWNLLRTDDSWTLVDWEEADAEAPPFNDIFHYLVQAHVHLGRPSRRAIVAGLAGEGWIGAALRAYAEGGRLDVSQGRRHLTAYLTARLVALPESLDAAAARPWLLGLVESLERSSGFRRRHRFSVLVRR